jgi:O-antigen ligase
MSAAPAATESFTPISRALAAVLVISFVVLLPSKTLFNVPVILMAAAGVWMVVTRWRIPAWRYRLGFLCVLFCLLWLPMLASLPGAIDGVRTTKAVTLYPRFLLASIFIVMVLSDGTVRRVCTLATAALAGFWTLDALVQFLVGVNVLGYPHEAGQLRGIFYPKYRLGMMLAIFIPLVFDVVFRQRLVHRAWGALIPLMVIVIALTLHRNSWVMLLLSCSVYAVFVVRVAKWRAPVRWVVVGAVLLLGVVALGVSQPRVKSRIVPSVQALFQDSAQLNAQLGQRSDIWRTAAAMFSSRWLTGVGARGFRTAYPAFAAQDDYWMSLEPPQQPSHPHQVMMEILAETGSLGLVGYLAFFAVLAFGWMRGPRTARLQCAPWFIAALVLAAPTNISKAFYGSAMASTTWWLISIGLAVLWSTQERHGT